MRDSDQIAIAAKAVAAAKQMLYGRMRFSGLAKEYVLWYRVVVMGTISHQVPREMTEMAMFDKTSLRRSCVIFIYSLGSRRCSIIVSLRDVSNTDPVNGAKK